MAVLKFPLEVASSGKLAVLTDNEKIVVQKITDYLSTNVLERPMMPSYGANTLSLVFENYDSLFFEEYKVEALAGLRRSISGAQVTNLKLSNAGLNAVSVEAETAVRIEVQYSLPPFGLRTAEVSVVNPEFISEDSPI